MKNLSRMKTGMMLHCLTAFVLLVSGCVSVDLKKPALDIKTYSIELDAPHKAAFAGEPVSIRINAFSAVPFFNDRYLAYRSGETAYEQDFYNQLIAAPAKLIQDEVAVWLKGSPMVAVVVTPGVFSPADYAIDGRVLELSGDYRVESDPKAVLKVQLTVTGLHSGDPNVLFQKIYTAGIPMKQISAVALTEGWSQGLSQVVAGFEADFSAMLGKSRQN
jgi:hypothetical protein